MPDALRALILVGGIAVLLSGEDRAWFLIAAFALSLLPRLVGVARGFDIAFVVATAINGAGNTFRLYERVTLFDEAAHLLTLLLITPALYAALAGVVAFPPLQGPTTRQRAAAAALATAALAMTMALLWELFEWGLDAALGTNLSLGYTDTLVDMAMGALGGLVAAALIVLSGTTRREGVERV